MASGVGAESCHIVLDGFITQTVKSRIVIEILKYLLYHREQIPLPFDQLNFQYQRQEVSIIYLVPYAYFYDVVYGIYLTKLSSTPYSKSNAHLHSKWSFNTSTLY